VLVLVIPLARAGDRGLPVRASRRPAASVLVLVIPLVRTGGLAVGHQESGLKQIELVWIPAYCAEE